MIQLKSEVFLNPAENVAVQLIICDGIQIQLHGHEFIELVYVNSGSGLQHVNGRTYAMEKGSLLFLNYNQSHFFQSDKGMTYYNILLKPEFMSETLINSVDAFALLALASFSDFQEAIHSPSPVIHFVGREMLEIEQIVDTMYREFQQKEAGYRTVLKGYMTVLFSYIFRHMCLPDPADDSPSSHSITPEILSYIEEHCFKKITLSELAQKSFYNPSYFSRIFKEYSGQSLTDYIHKKRIERAYALLTTTSFSVEQICSMVGYSDKKLFYKQFRLYTGLTPGEAKKQKKA